MGIASILLTHCSNNFC